MKHLLTIIIFLLAKQSGMAQTYTVKGSVSDTLNSTILPQASIVLFSAKDSTIVAHTRADTSGRFTLSASKGGKYILRITFPSFADHIESVNISKPTTDVGSIAMLTKEHLLKEFVITKEISAIKIKGDTTEYVADSFKVKENANVEDLLKRLPGIEVDKDGKITAQGETVQKILVDGEEFFSDDPKVVTKGLQANAVDKVQVFDKKSDQAEFTGIDDGSKTKTINLQLKENSKKGYFGKLDAGAGTDGYFQEQGMVNAFKGKRQISVFGISSNTDKVGLGWQDNGKFGAGNETQIDDGGGTYITTSNADDGFTGWDGSYNGQGLPKVWTGGVHFADKWDEDKDHVTGNYRYGKQQVEMDGTTTSLYALAGDTSNASYMQKSQFSRAERHNIDAMYEVKLDSSTSVKIVANAGYKTNQTLSIFNTTTSLRTNDVDDTLYTNKRNISGNTNADFINADLLLKRKFKKKGRTISIDAKENYSESRTDGHLYSTIVYDTARPIPSVTDQAKRTETSLLAFSAKATYTEPITKILNMEVNYGVIVNNSSALNYSYDSGHVLNNLYSSNYSYNIFSNVGGISLRWIYKKVNFFIGSDVANTNYLQTDMLNGNAEKRYNYLNLFPKASFKYKFNNQKAFNFSYSGKTQQPTITQIQPLVQNTDPTNIMIGNPNLKQEFINRLSATYNDYKVLTHRWMWLSAEFTQTNNAISTAQTNSEGINTTQYINVNGNYSANAWGNYGFKLAKTDLDLSIEANPNLNHINNVINGQKNTSDNNSFTGAVRLSTYKEDKYQVSFNPGITYNNNKATISTYSTNYWESNNEISATVNLSKKLEIGTEVNFMFRERTPVFTSNNNVIKWNAYVGRKFLKKSELEVRLSVFDILNQNIGYDRTAQGSIITQNTYNTIRRYGMLNVIWNFTHRPGAAATDDESKN